MGQMYGFLLLPGSFLIHGMKMWGTWDRHEIGSLGQRELCGWDIYLWRAIYFGNSMENERFQLQNVAKTVEMAASSSKMLQIARKTGRKADPKKSQNGKTKTQNNSGPFTCCLLISLGRTWILISQFVGGWPLLAPQNGLLLTDAGKCHRKGLPWTVKFPIFIHRETILFSFEALFFLFDMSPSPTVRDTVQEVRRSADAMSRELHGGHLRAAQRHSGHLQKGGHLHPGAGRTVPKIVPTFC